MGRHCGRLVVVFLACIASPALAQTPAARDEPATKFEKFALAKGSVRVREYYDIADLPGRFGRARFQVARAYTPGTTDFAVALQVNVEEASTSRLSPREHTGVLDADEVAGLVAALPQMGKMMEVIKQGQKASNTEGDFRGGSLKFSFFVSSRGSNREGLAIQAGEIGAVTAFFDVGDLPKIVDIVNQSLAKIRELQQRR